MHRGLTAAHGKGIIIYTVQCTEASTEGLKRNQLTVTVGDRSFGLTGNILTGHIVTLSAIKCINRGHLHAAHNIETPAVFRHTISYHTIPYHIVPYRIIPYHIEPYHIISYHTISYHIVSYHITKSDQASRCTFL